MFLFHFRISGFDSWKLFQNSKIPILLRYAPYDASVPEAEQGKYVKLSWDDGDKTVVQIDMSSVNHESTVAELMTCYRYLLMIEKTKRVTSYDISYTTCSRKVGQGGDGFDIKPQNLHCYQTSPDLSKPLTCKSIFWDSAVKVKESKALMTCFRFRFDRVHAVTKVQKPYVFTKLALTLEAGKPVQVA